MIGNQDGRPSEMRKIIICLDGNWEGGVRSEDLLTD